MNKLKRTDWAYLAGLLDGDGCFTISITQSRRANGDRKKVILISPRIVIGLKASDSLYLSKLFATFGVGKMYWHKMMTVDAKASWHVLRLADVIAVSEGVLPYLLIKRDRAAKFLEVCRYWQSLQVSVPEKMKGYRHSQAQMLHIISVACTINFDRQTVRYRSKKGLPYWTPLVKEWYPT